MHASSRHRSGWYGWKHRVLDYLSHRLSKYLQNNVHFDAEVYSHCCEWHQDRSCCTKSRFDLMTAYFRLLDNEPEYLKLSICISLYLPLWWWLPFGSHRRPDQLSEHTLNHSGDAEIGTNYIKMVPSMCCTCLYSLYVEADWWWKASASDFKIVYDIHWSCLVHHLYNVFIKSLVN